VSAQNLIFLVFALVLLLIPRSWLRLGARVTPKPPRKYNQAKVERDPYDHTVKPEAEAMKPRNWLDLFRGMVGAGVLFYVAEDKAGSAGLVATPYFGWAIALLVIAVVSQMIRLQGRLGLFAPIFFLQGVNLGINGAVVGLIVMLGSWALSPVLPSAGALLFVQGATALILCFLLNDATPAYGLVVAGLCWVPVLVSILMRKRLSASFDKKLKIIPRDARAD
jgi:hypothetical protein